jgi:hypothetical protein
MKRHRDQNQFAGKENTLLNGYSDARTQNINANNNFQNHSSTVNDRLLLASKAYSLKPHQPDRQNPRTAAIGDKGSNNSVSVNEEVEGVEYPDYASFKNVS